MRGVFPLASESPVDRLAVNCSNAMGPNQWSTVGTSLSRRWPAALTCAHDGVMADMWQVQGGQLEPFLLAVVATGTPLADGPVALQVLWLVAVAVAAFLGRSRLSSSAGPE